jgi:hypothetical protein
MEAIAHNKAGTININPLFIVPRPSVTLLKKVALVETSRVGSLAAAACHGLKLPL